MIFDRNEKKQVVALLGAGSMGTAIVRRIAAGKKVLLGDISERALERVSDDFRRSGYDVETQVVNALEKESVEAFAKRAAELGPVMYFIDTAGASPRSNLFACYQRDARTRPRRSTSSTSTWWARAMLWMPSDG